MLLSPAGDIGGQMGLFIGASILTILELFDYLYEVRLCQPSPQISHPGPPQPWIFCSLGIPEPPQNPVFPTCLIQVCHSPISGWE